MAFHADESDEDLKYIGPKKKKNKQKHNEIVTLDPEFTMNLGKKHQPYKK